MKLAAVAFSVLSLTAAMALQAEPARAQSFRGEESRGVPARRLLGSWIGEYVCAQGVTRLHLNVAEATPDFVRAVFHFYESPRNPGVPTGCFTVAGRYSAKTRRIDLRPEKWLLKPPDYMMVGVSGRFAADGANFTGSVTGAPGCTRVTLLKWSEPPSAPPECRPEEP